jgi:hypothetical protein
VICSSGLEGSSRHQGKSLISRKRQIIIKPTKVLTRFAAFAIVSLTGDVKKVFGVDNTLDEVEVLRIGPHNHP